MNTPRILQALCLLTFLPAAAFAWEKDKPAKPPVIPPNPNGLPLVLLIGDSISGGYHQQVAKALEGKAVVAKSSDNGESTAVGVLKIDGWLGTNQWDVIHFNWGVWDMYGWQYAADDRSPAKYAERLDQLVTRMKKTGAKLIWATTTPVPPKPEATILKRWQTEVVISPERELEYREAALAVMKKHGVAVNDLYAVLKPRRSEFQADDNVHFSGAGSGLMAEHVAKAILEQLGSPMTNTPTAVPGRPAAAQKPVAEMQEDFLKLKFGMFIHFNMETYKGVQWVAGYQNPADFNPGGPVDTDAWADAAKAAGMKYAVLTAKHVSGFCLWDSKYTTYDVMNPNCPYQRDLVAQFIKSFTSRGLKVGLYYCWRNREFASRYKVLPPECDPATHSFAEQIEFQKKQIAELVEKYPDAFCIWNDGLEAGIMPAAEANAFYRGLGRDVLAVANWWDWSKKGTPFLDIAVKETLEFPENNQYPGETCWKLEQGWFWAEGARPMPVAEIVALLNRANHRRSNFLLNVGPNQQGKLEPASITVLAEVGKLTGRQP